MPWTSSCKAARDDLVDRSVVAEMDDLDARRLQHPPDDVDRGVVAVEQRGGGDEAHGVAGPIVPRINRLAGRLRDGNIVGHFSPPRLDFKSSPPGLAVGSRDPPPPA